MKSLIFIMFSFYFLFANMAVAIPVDKCFCGHIVEDGADLVNHVAEKHERKPTFYHPLEYIC